MKKFVYGILLFALALVALQSLVASSLPEIVAQNGNALVAVRVAAGIDDPLSSNWDAIPALVVPLKNDITDPIMRYGVTYPPAEEVSLQAIYTDDMVYIRAVWRDDTQDDIRSQWTYTENGWVKNSYNEDRISFMFDINGGPQFAVLGCGAACHTASETTNAHMGFAPDSANTTDFWHWKASRSVGYTDDQWVGPAVADAEGKLNGRANDARTSGGTVDNVNEAKDGPKFFYAEGVNPRGHLFIGDAVEITADMTFTVGQTVPYYVQNRPEGSRGDINTTAVYVSIDDNTGYWYLVISRAFNTGNPDDTVFTLNANHPFGVAVYNQVGGANHSYSDPLTLSIGE